MSDQASTAAYGRPVTYWSAALTARGCVVHSAVAHAGGPTSGHQRAPVLRGASSVRYVLCDEDLEDSGRVDTGVLKIYRRGRAEHLPFAQVKQVAVIEPLDEQGSVGFV
jgi:hypothetical protein